MKKFLKQLFHIHKWKITGYKDSFSGSYRYYTYYKCSKCGEGRESLST